MASPFTADVGRLARTLPRVPRGLTRRRVAIAVVAALLLAAGYQFWFRDSSLVAIEEVDVSGLNYSREDITGALTAAAEEMTTLNADVGALERAVEDYPSVASLSIDPSFPHGLAITVTERPPVASVGGGEGVAVAGDGTVLSGVDVGDGRLPTIEATDPPASGRLRGVALTQAEVIGATPAPLRPAIEAAGVDRELGVVVSLVEGIEIRFGDSSEAAAKWAAAAAILADEKLDQLDYIDVRLPGRPAVGGAPLPEPSADEVATEVPEAPVPVDPAAVDPAVTEAAPVPVDPAAAAPPADPAATAPAPAPAPASAPASGVAGSTAAP